MEVAFHTKQAVAPDGVVARAPGEETGDVVRLRLRGALTAALATGVRELFRNHVGMGCVRSIDAAGVAALLDGRRVVEAGSGGVPYLRAGSVVGRALRQTGTVSAFRLWPDAEA